MIPLGKRQVTSTGLSGGALSQKS
nr:unnamed protein product [Callosobruchus analis]